MRKSSFVWILLLVCAFSAAAGCGKTAGSTGKLVLSVTIPPGPSAYPDIPQSVIDDFMTQGRKALAREIPAGTTWIDVIVANVSEGVGETYRIVTDNPAAPTYTRTITLPAGAGYTVEIIAGAAGIVPVEISLVSGRATGLSIIAGETTPVDIELQRMVFTPTEALPYPVNVGEIITVKGTLQTPIALSGADIDGVGLVMEDETATYGLQLLSDTSPSFTPGVPVALTLTGTVPSAPDGTALYGRYLLVGYTNPYSNDYYLLTAEAADAPYVFTLVYPSGALGITVH